MQASQTIALNCWLKLLCRCNPKPMLGCIGPIIMSLKHVHQKAQTTKTNYYDLLKVNEDANKQDIKSAYYELSKKYHPDQNKVVNSNQLFIEITEAYETLIDNDKRKIYDGNLVHSAFNLKNNKASNPIRKRTTYTAYRSTSSRKTYTGRDAHFNYDEWMRQHYTETFHQTRKTYERAKQNNYSDYATYKWQKNFNSFANRYKHEFNSKSEFNSSKSEFNRQNNFNKRNKNSIDPEILYSKVLIYFSVGVSFIFFITQMTEAKIRSYNEALNFKSNKRK